LEEPGALVRRSLSLVFLVCRRTGWNVCCQFFTKDSRGLNQWQKLDIEKDIAELKSLSVKEGLVQVQIQLSMKLHKGLPY